MKKSLGDQIKSLQTADKLPVYRNRKRHFPIVTADDIVPGAIIYVTLSEEDGLKLRGWKEKDKWIVVIGTTSDGYIIGSLLINTNPNTFSRELGEIQFPMTRRSYPFLDYNSWLDCSELFRIPQSKILKFGGFCGNVSTDD